MRWDAKNFGFETHETYNPSEAKYYEEHGERIVNLMNLNKVVMTKTLIRNRYNIDWISKNQLVPLILGK